MKVKELKVKKVLVKYGPLHDPEKFSEDLLRWYKENLYEANYSFEETEIRSTNHLSPVPYSETDRATMPPNYQCMGSLTVWFATPQGSVSPFSFVDFWHSDKKHDHHNTWIYWRNFDGSSKGCASNKLKGHAKVEITSDMSVSLWIDGKELFKGVIPGKKKA